MDELYEVAPQLKETVMNYAITIGREFGSGGRELGKLLAQKLNIPFYDRELLSQVAKKSGINLDFFVNNDEKLPSFTNGTLSFGFGFNMPWHTSSSISEDNLYKTQSDFIRHLVDSGPCVIVGRTADYVLRHNPNVINVFLHADMADCVKRIISRSDCKDEAKAQALANRTNKLRASFYNFYTDKEWGKASSYDLSFNSSKMSMEDISDIIIEYVRRRVGDVGK